MLLYLTDVSSPSRLRARNIRPNIPTTTYTLTAIAHLINPFCRSLLFIIINTKLNDSYQFY
mgnify:CR=1